MQLSKILFVIRENFNSLIHNAIYYMNQNHLNNLGLAPGIPFPINPTMETNNYLFQ